MAWIENGPVSVPTTPVVVTVGVMLALAAALSVGFGVKSSWREANHPAHGDLDSQAAGQAVIAQPIVELPQPLAAPATVAATNSAKEADDSADIAAKTAAAQAVQSKPAQSASNIDDILTSPSEKPQAPAKPSTDEAPPSGSDKSDVPF